MGIHCLDPPRGLCHCEGSYRIVAFLRLKGGWQKSHTTLPFPSDQKRQMKLRAILQTFFAALAWGASDTQPGATAVLDDSCRDAPLSLVQSRASSRGKGASQQAGPKPWEKHYYFVGTHHKSGSQLLRDVTRTLRRPLFPFFLGG